MSENHEEIEIDDDALELVAGGPMTKPVNTTGTAGYGWS
jgi:hypothetical protein